MRNHLCLLEWVTSTVHLKTFVISGREALEVGIDSVWGSFLLREGDKGA